MHRMSQADSSAAVWRPHATVACVVPRDERYLMVEETINGRAMFNQPAGHLEDGESVFAAAVRETLEETGWNVELQHLIGVQQWRSSEHGDMVLRFSFAARTLDHDVERALDPDITRALWMTRSEIAALGDRLRSPLILCSIDAWLAGQRLPLTVIDYLAAGSGT